MNDDENNLPQRKHRRLRDYDYSQNGCYFVTVCTKNRAKIFGEVVGRGFLDAPTVELTEIGNHINDAIIFVDRNVPHVKIEKYVIMPNHLHIMIVIRNEENGGASGKPRPTEAIIPKLISSLKRYTNRVCQKELWQDSFHDHIIRDDNDYQTHWQYIDDNPAKWVEDEYYIE